MPVAAVSVKVRVVPFVVICGLAIVPKAVEFSKARWIMNVAPTGASQVSCGREPDALETHLAWRFSGSCPNTNKGERHRANIARSLVRVEVGVFMVVK